MFIDKVCVLHRQSKWCYFADEVHILFLGQRIFLVGKLSFKRIA